MNNLSEALLAKAAEQARIEVGYLGFLLSAYQQHERLDEGELATMLGCDVSRIYKLCLCRLPRAEQFASDINMIADRVGIAPLALARVIRLAESLATLEASEGYEEGLRAARRKGENDDSDNKSEPAR